MLFRKRSLPYFKMLLPLLFIADVIVSVNLNSYYTLLGNVKPQKINRYMQSQPKGFPIPEKIEISQNTEQKLSHAPLWRNMGILTKNVSFEGFSSFLLDSYNTLADSFPSLKEQVLNNPLIYLSGDLRSNSTFRTDTGKASTHKTIVINDPLFAKLENIHFKKSDCNTRIDILSFTPHHILAKYESDSTSIITLLQTDYKGWHTKIDNKHADHFTSNYNYISILAPAGKHIIEFEYKNNLVIVLFLLSYATLIMLITIVIYQQVNKYSQKKAIALSVFFLSICAFLFIRFLSSSTIAEQQTKTFDVFSKEIKKWNKVYPDQIAITLNIDDTNSFQSIFETQLHNINFLRFRNNIEKGRFYRTLTAQKEPYFAYGYCNLENPSDIDFLIKDVYPRSIQSEKTGLGTITLYSKNNKQEEKSVFSSLNTFESNHDGWQQRSDSSISKSGKFSEKLDSNRIYSATFRKKCRELAGIKSFVVKAKAEVFLEEGSSPLLVFEVRRNEEVIDWEAFDVRKFIAISNSWEKIIFIRVNNNEFRPNDVIGIYFWNQTTKKTCFIDNFSIDIYKNGI